VRDREATQLVAGKRVWREWVLEEPASKEVIYRGLHEAGFKHEGAGVYHLNKEVVVCVSEGFMLICACGEDSKQRFEIVYFESRGILWDVIREIWSSR
jgi:hypothetical protein